MNIERYELQRIHAQQDEFVLVIHLDNHLVEFASELGTEPRSQQSLRSTAIQIIKAKYPNMKVTAIKVMVGGLLVTSIPLVANTETVSAQTPIINSQSTETSAIYYYVAPGDTLWNISRKFGTTVDNIKRGNNLTVDSLQVNQRLLIPKAIHTVAVGDYLSVLASNYNTTVSAIREANSLTSDTVRLGQILIIPILVSGSQTAQTPAQSTSYTVVAGDSLSVIAKRFGVSTEALRTANNLNTDVLQIGQRLVIPNTNVTPSAPTQPTTYKVVSGDSLWALAKRFNTTVDALRSTNNLRTDALQIGQILTIPTSGTMTTPSIPSPTVISHTVVSGDSLWSLAERYNTTVNALRSANNLKTDMLQVGQVLTIPSSPTGIVTPTPVQEVRTTFTYRVVAGDNLTVIANRFGVTVAAIRTANNLSSDMLHVGQALTIPNGMNAPTQTSVNRITYTTHTVVSGDNLWDLSIRYGIPQTELMNANNLTSRSMLSIGQKLTIPVHHIAVKPVVSERHGELLDWWTEAQYVFPIGKVATVTDFATGKSFKIKRTIGANHADSETLTVQDTNIAREIWGGFSWTPRAVIVEVDGRKLAASMSFMPHDVQYISNNGITGHFDVYFSNSTRHVDGKPDAQHQAQVERASGLR